MNPLHHFLQEHRLQEGSRVKVELQDGTQLRGQLHGDSFAPEATDLILFLQEFGYLGVAPSDITSIKEVGFGPFPVAAPPPPVWKLKATEKPTKPAKARTTLPQGPEPWLTESPFAQLTPQVQVISVDFHWQDGPLLPWLHEQLDVMPLPRDHTLRWEGETQRELRSSDNLRDIAHAVGDALNQGVSGVVVVCPQQRLGWLATALTWMVQFPPVPIVCCGLPNLSLIQPHKLLTDLQHACQAAVCLDCAEVLVSAPVRSTRERYLLHRSTHVEMTHTSAGSGWSSRFPVASIQGEALALHTHDSPPRWREREAKLVPGWSSDVVRLPFSAYAPPFLLEAYLPTAVRGVLLEGPRDEPLPQNWLPAIKQLLERGVPVLVTSQAAHGVLKTEGLQNPLDAGAKKPLVLPPMLASTAYSKLCWAVGVSESVTEVQARMLHNVAGEFLRTG
ncbi:MAG: hypothetical protein EP343_10715 [Deltaproteobacteria bacterium]|nr:MAG: hypothetical protein EP343_10715 [Deltaproteobacteria bacterium]